MMSELSLLEAAIKAGASAGATQLVKSIVKHVGSVNFSEKDLVSALGTHLHNSFDKCSKVKTILRDSQEIFSDIYLPQKIILSDEEKNTNDLVELMGQHKSIIIQVTGGSGKSMLVRYLWLLYFSGIKNYIPIFVELRNLNNSENIKLIDYIYHTAVSETNSLSQSNFNKALGSGAIVIFLDGFDEIALAKRNHLQDEIIALREKYAKLSIVLTSRPDDRFSGWHQFQTIRMAALSKEEAVKVILRAPFEPTARQRFADKVQDELYARYDSFFENPLLCYMTLVTHYHNPNFTDKMVYFYQQAFDALYYRHDLYKDGKYKREFKCNLDRISFEKLLAYFSMRTYFDEKIDFSRDEIHQYIRRAINFDQQQFASVEIDDFVRDLIENVCLLKREGLILSFTHRKFQEYFAALCISQMTNAKTSNIIMKFAERTSDDVVKMVYQLNSNLFVSSFLKKIEQNNRKFFRLKNEKAICNQYVRITSSKCEVVFLRHDGKDKRFRGYSTSYAAGTALGGIAISICNICLKSDYLSRLMSSAGRRSVFREINAGRMVPEQCERIQILFSYDNPQIDFFDENNCKIQGDLSIFVDWYDSFYRKMIVEEALAFHGFVNAEISKHNLTEDNFDDLFPV